jgi:hypothetical protein
MSSSQRGISMPDHVIQLLVSGQKSQLRVPVVPTLLPHQEPMESGPGVYMVQTAPLEDATVRTYRCPIGVPGERLWVREPFRMVSGRARYRQAPDEAGLQPARQMTVEHSRIHLSIQSVRMVRLCTITEEEAQAEGVWAWMMHQNKVAPQQREKLQSQWMKASQRSDGSVTPTYRGLYALMWDLRSNPVATAWDLNPWVWRIEFDCKVSSA